MPRAVSLPHTVSVVDDETSVREAMESLLRSAGYTVRLFASAEDFLSSGNQGATACLIVDLQMPGMSGLDLQRRCSHGTRRIPIIFLTGHYDHESRKKAMNAGALAFFRKPFPEQALMEAVRSAFNENGDLAGLRRSQTILPAHRRNTKTNNAGTVYRIHA